MSNSGRNSFCMNRYLRVNMKKKASEYIVGSRPNPDPNPNPNPNIHSSDHIRKGMWCIFLPRYVLVTEPADRR